LSAFFVAAFTLAYWRRSDGLLRLLVPAGQMGLTTYLMQSVLGLSVFYGFGLGLMGKMGVTATVVLGLALYALQILLAVAWMQRYRSGPVEWLWRSLTYWKLQPIRREPDSALAATTP
jgi:uncharacterized protein